MTTFDEVILIFFLFLEQLQFIKRNMYMFYIHFFDRLIIIFTFNSMSSVINSKRQQLRKEIIKKQKQQLFQLKRRQLRRSLLYPEGISNPVKQLKQRNKVKQSIEYIKLKMGESDFFEDLMKFMEQGLINVLIRYLHQQTQIQSVFQIICLILDKNQMNFDKAFYHYGLIEYIFQYLQQSHKVSYLCLRILFIYTEKSTDYCELLFQNSKHQTIIEYFLKRASYSRDPQDENENEGDKIYTIMLLILQNLIKAHYQSQPYNQYRLQILQFNLALIQKRLFLKQTIGILYQCVSHLHNPTQYFNLMLVYVNQLLKQVKSQDKYLYNLFALIYNMAITTPIELASFSQFVKIGVMTKKVNKPFVKIIQRFTTARSECLNSFPRDEFTWEKMFLAADDPQVQKTLFILIEYFQIASDWIWKYYSQALKSDDSSVKITVIDIMNRILRKSKSQQKLLNYLHLHRIPVLLEKIVANDKMIINIKPQPLTVVQKATHLLDYILGPMTDQSEQQGNTI